MFEKLQLDNTLRIINTRVKGLEMTGQIDSQQYKMLKAQQEDLIRWCGWLTANDIDLPVVPAGEQDLYEPSAALRHFWIGFLYEKSHVPFNVVMNYYLEDLDIDMFKMACRRIIEKHEVFRTVGIFNEYERTVKQKILAECELDAVVSVIDISTCDKIQQQVLIDKYIDKARNHIFLYQQLPSFYFELLKCGERQYYIIFNISHAFFDGFSRDIFEEDFQMTYEACVQGRATEIDKTVIRFRDFCLWEQTYQSQDLRTLFSEYWFSQNSSRFPQENLSTYCSRSVMTDDSYRTALKRRIKAYLKNTSDETIEAFYGIVAKAERSSAKSYRFVLSGEIFSRLNVLCGQRLITIYPIIITVLNILIYKKTRINDVIIGANIAIRDRAAFRRLIGFMVNTILIRNRVEGGSRFDDLLTSVIINSSLASFFKPYTMSKLLDDMDIPFNAVNTVFLNMLPVRQSDLLSEFDSSHKEETIPGYFDIDLHVQQYSNGIEFICNYNFSIYSKEDIVLLFDQFRRLFEDCLLYPEIKIDEIELSYKSGSL